LETPEGEPLKKTEKGRGGGGGPNPELKKKKESKKQEVKAEEGEKKGPPKLPERGSEGSCLK